MAILLQGDPSNLQGGSANLQGGYNPQQAASPVQAPTVTAPRPTIKPVASVKPIVARQSVQVAQPDSQINSIFQPFIGSRPSPSSPGTLEYYNKQTGQGFVNAGELYNFASTLGAGVISSFDQLHAPVMQGGAQSVQPLTDPNQTTAEQAGLANLSVDDLLKLIQARSQLTPEQLNSIYTGLGIPEASQAAFTPPQQSTVDFYNQLYGNAGLSDVKQKIQDLNEQITQRQQNFIDAQGTINENPFLSEASRVGRISRLNDKAQQEIGNLLNQQQQYQSLYQNALNEINNVVTLHTNDFQTNQQLSGAKLNYLLSVADKQAAAQINQSNQAAYQYLPAYLQSKAKATAPGTVTAPNGATFYYDKNSGTFQQLVGPGGNFDVNPITGDIFSKNTGQAVGGGYAAGLNFSTNAPAGGFRTDRHNNPTAMTTDVAASSGLVLGKDYVQGDPFTGKDGKTYYTAKLLGDPIATTIKAIDQGGFYTKSGTPRWSYLSSIPDAKNWANLSYDQKARVVAQMYAQEGGNGSLVQGSGTGGNSLQTTAQQLVDGLLSPTQISERTPGYQQILQYAQTYSQQKYGKPFNLQEAEQNYQAKQQALNQNATSIRQIVNSQQTALSHLGELESIAKKVNFSEIPSINEVRIYASDHVLSDANIKELQSTINIIRGEVAKVLGGGTATVEALNEAQSILPFNIPYSQLQNIIGKVKTLMQEKINSYSNLNNIPQFGGTPSNQPSNSSDPLGLF